MSFPCLLSFSAVELAPLPLFWIKERLYWILKTKLVLDQFHESSKSVLVFFLVICSNLLKVSPAEKIWQSLPKAEKVCKSTRKYVKVHKGMLIVKCYESMLVANNQHFESTLKAFFSSIFLCVKASPSRACCYQKYLFLLLFWDSRSKLRESNFLLTMLLNYQKKWNYKVKHCFLIDDGISNWHSTE